MVFRQPHVTGKDVVMTTVLETCASGNEHFRKKTSLSKNMGVLMDISSKSYDRL